MQHALSKRHCVVGALKVLRTLTLLGSTIYETTDVRLQLFDVRACLNTGLNLLRVTGIDTVVSRLRTNPAL